MADSDTYILGRDYVATVRLNSQHAIWTDMFGLLHPSIPVTSNDPQGLSIIDVGTGTASWPLALQHQLKAPIKTLLGTDISEDQFPNQTWLPEAVKLVKLDALDPNGPPEELRGQFDIVYARFLVTLIEDKPDRLIDFFSKLLKPGGYLQWGEPYVPTQKVEVPDDYAGSTDGLNSMLGMLTGKRSWEWNETFDDNLKPFGFEIVALDR